MHNGRTRAGDLYAFTGAANVVVGAMLALQVLGWIMSRALSRYLGFLPVWFLDCTGCLARGSRIGVNVPLIGGVSVWLMVGVAAVVLLAVWRRRAVRGPMYRVVAIIAGLAMAAFAIIAADTRYPGSLPGLVVTVVPSVAAAGLYFAAATRQAGELRSPPRLSATTMASLGSGLASMALLGGIVSLLAVGVGVVAIDRANDGRNRSYATLGLLLALVSIAVRWSIISRYSFIGVFA